MKNIMIIGSFGGGNFGDTIVLESIIRNITDTFKDDIQLIVPTSNPGFIYSHISNNGCKKIRAVDINHKRNMTFRFFGFRLLRELHNTDLIVTTAGILFDQKYWDPRFSFISSLLPLLIVAKSIGIKTIGLCVGITPKSNIVGGWILEKTIKMHDYIATRDEESAKIARHLLADKHVSAHADIAHTLEFNNNEARYHRVGDLHVAINLSRYIHGLYSGNNLNIELEVWIREITDMINSWKNFISDITFVSTTPKDNNLHEKVANQIGSVKNLKLYKMSTNDVISRMKQFDIAIGSRMHSCILFTSLKIPTLAFSYHPKVDSYMKSLGLSKWVIPIEQVSDDTVTPLLQDLIHKRKEIRDHLDTCIATLRKSARNAVVQLENMVSHPEVDSY